MLLLLLLQGVALGQLQLFLLLLLLLQGVVLLPNSRLLEAERGLRNISAPSNHHLLLLPLLLLLLLLLLYRLQCSMLLLQAFLSCA